MHLAKINATLEQKVEETWTHECADNANNNFCWIFLKFNSVVFSGHTSLVGVTAHTNVIHKKYS